MKRRIIFVIVLYFCIVARPSLGQDYSDEQLDSMDRRLTQTYQALELHKTDSTDISENHGWILRSSHFVFGMPRLVDRRHDFSPYGENSQPGISALVREGFVIAHFDRMRAPLFVCQRWTKADYHRMKNMAAHPPMERRFRVANLCASWDRLLLQ